jgi:photosystem II stability/assembly factor-like uncharacterized protein
MSKQKNLFAVIFILLLSSGCHPQQTSFPVTGLITADPLSLSSSDSVTTFFSTHWQAVAELNEHHNIMTAGFLNEQFGITGGVVGEMHYTTDGGQSWPTAVNQSDCRYGMEIVDRQIAWTCGGMTHVRLSKDGGKTWQEAAAFGNYRTIKTACHSMSFHDDKIGWLANSELFGFTEDGGQSWRTPPLPQEANKIATIDSYAPGQGYLLDQDGMLFSSHDNGQSWKMISRLPFGDFKMPKSVYQMAAMRFLDAQSGMMVVYLRFGETEKMEAYTTTDGGMTWVSENIPVAPGPPYLSRDSGLLTVITGPNILTLLRYIP